MTFEEFRSLIMMVKWIFSLMRSRYTIYIEVIIGIINIYTAYIWMAKIYTIYNQGIILITNIIWIAKIYTNYIQAIILSIMILYIIYIQIKKSIIKIGIIILIGYVLYLCTICTIYVGLLYLCTICIIYVHINFI
jgi:hypothetical protein